jgi:hypothetical protein
VQRERVETPVAAFPRVLARSRHLHEGLVEGQVVADGVLPAGVRLVPVVGELLLHQEGVPVSSQHTHTSLRATVSRDFFSLDSFMGTVPPRRLIATLKDSVPPPPQYRNR